MQTSDDLPVFWEQGYLWYAPMNFSPTDYFKEFWSDDSWKKKTGIYVVS